MAFSLLGVWTGRQVARLVTGDQRGLTAAYNEIDSSTRRGRSNARVGSESKHDALINIHSRQYLRHYRRCQGKVLGLPMSLLTLRVGSVSRASTRRDGSSFERPYCVQLPIGHHGLAKVGTRRAPHLLLGVQEVVLQEQASHLIGVSLFLRTCLLSL